MRSGQLRFLVGLQSPVVNQLPGSGEAIYTHETVAEVRAKVIEDGGNEQKTSEQVQATRNYTVTIRHYPGIDERWRVIHEGRVLGISSLASDDRRREVVMRCVEVD